MMMNNDDDDSDDDVVDDEDDDRIEKARLICTTIHHTYQPSVLIGTTL